MGTDISYILFLNYLMIFSLVHLNFMRDDTIVHAIMVVNLKDYAYTFPALFRSRSLENWSPAMKRLTAHFEGIESMLLEQIENAEHSIHIVMAWLTSKAVKEALLWAKRDDPGIQIVIVVDDNEINDGYFYNTKQEFEECGILLKQKVDKRFLHRKFMVVDEKITLIGSYNYTRKAKYNAENISIIENEHISKVHLRIFKALTDATYRDENIDLLFEFPLFAQKLLSTYYPFNRGQFKKYYSQLFLGYCFTHFNGYYNEVTYFPGFIFNPNCRLDKKLISTEFDLPVSKRGIKNWTQSRNANVVIDSYKDYPELWDEINDALKIANTGTKRQFKTVISSTHTYNQLKKLINDEVDIIKEDRLWHDNFQPFLDEQTVDELFLNFPIVSKDYSTYELFKLAK